MLQVWVHDACIICKIACNLIRTMIVIVNPEYHIIVLIACDSVLQFSSRVCWVILQFLHLSWWFHNLPSFYNCSCKLWSCTWPELKSPPVTHISVEVVRFLQLPIRPNNVLYHQWLIIITIYANCRMKLKFIFISYPMLH